MCRYIKTPVHQNVNVKNRNASANNFKFDVSDNAAMPKY